MHWFRRRTNGRWQHDDIAPEDIFLDSCNLPAFDTHHLEGRIPRPLNRRSFALVGGAFLVLGFMVVSRLWYLQVAHGADYLAVSERNRLSEVLLFPARGTIIDRAGEELAWNEIMSGDAASGTHAFVPRRRYTDRNGFAHVLGYVSYPKKDARGVYFQREMHGIGGVEEFYNEVIAGMIGRALTETDVYGSTISEVVVDNPENGEPLHITIDARLQEALYGYIANVAAERGFLGGAGVLLDVQNGDVIALTSFPEYDPEILSDAKDRDTIEGFIESEKEVFLNRVIGGLYTPGSIVKPFLAVGALAEDLVTPETTIYSSGKLVLPNPYDSDNPSVFKDWKAHGFVDVVRAIAVSSNVYFYEVGGGFGGQKGLGIAGIEKFIRLFGIGETSGIDIPGEVDGVVPNPAWKEKTFPGDPWRVGDTYHTAIGQYGFQVTPIQMARAVAAIANGGFLITPHLSLNERVAPREKLSLDADDVAVVRQGMREAVRSGTGSGMNVSYLSIAAKTGTAEVGISRKHVNSWIIGFFPYEEPRYAFAVVMEKGPRENTVGALFVMRQFVDWLYWNAPEYFG